MLTRHKRENEEWVEKMRQEFDAQRKEIADQKVAWPVKSWRACFADWHVALVVNAETSFQNQSRRNTVILGIFAVVDNLRLKETANIKNSKI